MDSDSTGLKKFRANRGKTLNTLYDFVISSAINAASPLDRDGQIGILNDILKDPIFQDIGVEEQIKILNSLFESRDFPIDEYARIFEAKFFEDLSSEKKSELCFFIHSQISQSENAEAERDYLEYALNSKALGLVNWDHNGADNDKLHLITLYLEAASKGISTEDYDTFIQDINTLAINIRLIKGSRNILNFEFVKNAPDDLKKSMFIDYFSSDAEEKSGHFVQESSSIDRTEFANDILQAYCEHDADKIALDIFKGIVDGTSCTNWSDWDRLLFSRMAPGYMRPVFKDALERFLNSDLFKNYDEGYKWNEHATAALTCINDADQAQKEFFAALSFDIVKNAKEDEQYDFVSSFFGDYSDTEKFDAQKTAATLKKIVEHNVFKSWSAETRFKFIQNALETGSKDKKAKIYRAILGSQALVDLDPEQQKTIFEAHQNYLEEADYFPTYVSLLQGSYFKSKDADEQLRMLSHWRAFIPENQRVYAAKTTLASETFYSDWKDATRAAYGKKALFDFKKAKLSSVFAVKTKQGIVAIATSESMALDGDSSVIIFDARNGVRCTSEQQDGLFDAQALKEAYPNRTVPLTHLSELLKMFKDGHNIFAQNKRMSNKIDKDYKLLNPNRRYVIDNEEKPIDIVLEIIPYGEVFTPS